MMMNKWSQVLDAQLSCAEFWESDYYVNRLLTLWHEEDRDTTNIEVTAVIAQIHMRDLEPVFVAEDIVDLATHASRSFEFEQHRVEDFFTPQGFAVLEKPYSYHRSDGLLAEMRYVWWVWTLPDTEAQAAALGLDYRPVGIVCMSGDAQYDDEQLNTVPSFRWVPQVMYKVAEGDTPANDEPCSSDGTDPVAFLQALMRLAQQPLAEHTEAAADRPTRRRIQRAGGTPRPITTITLRRPKGASTGAASSREYTHRWMVNGFWRNQFYPSLGTHRQIYINSYIKGPEDAPLVLSTGASTSGDSLRAALPECIVVGIAATQPRRLSSVEGLSRCKRRRRASSFSSNRSKPDGLATYCKDCVSNTGRVERYRKRHLDPNYREQFYRRRLLARYGLTEAEYTTLVESSKGKCACCGKKPGGPKPLCIDHDHETGKVRALVCTQCNVGIAMFQEDPRLMIKAIRYLQKHKEL